MSNIERNISTNSYTGFFLLPILQHFETDFLLSLNFQATEKGTILIFIIFSLECLFQVT